MSVHQGELPSQKRNYRIYSKYLLTAPQKFNIRKNRTVVQLNRILEVRRKYINELKQAQPKQNTIPALEFMVGNLMGSEWLEVMRYPFPRLETPN